MSNVAAAIKSLSLNGLNETQYRQCDNFLMDLSTFLDNTTPAQWQQWYGHQKPEGFGKNFINVSDDVLEQYVDGCYNTDEHLEALEIILA